MSILMTTLARMLAIMIAGSIFLTAMVDIQQAAALACKENQDGDVEDKRFDPGESGITSAKLHCSKGEPKYCDFGKDSNGEFVRPILTNGRSCGLDNEFECFCSIGKLFGEYIPEVRLLGKTVYCGYPRKGPETTTNFYKGKSGAKEVSLYCDKSLPLYCLYKFAPDSSSMELQVSAEYNKDPQPCGANSEYFCYCDAGHNGPGSAIVRIRKNRQLTKSA